MNIRPLIEQFARRINKPATTAVEKAYILECFNPAARELWNMQMGSTWKELTVASSGRYLLLPATVGRIRGIKSCTNRLGYNDMIERYHNPWAEYPNSFRDLGMQPLKVSQPNADDGLRLSFAVAPTAQTIIKLRGETGYATSGEVLVTFEVGELVKEIDNPFLCQFSVNKDIHTPANLVVTTNPDDADDAVTLAVVDNADTTVRYRLVELGACLCDTYCAQDYVGYFDMAYQPQFRGFTSFDDEYALEGFDDALLAKALEWHAVLNLAASPEIDAKAFALINGKFAAIAKLTTTAEDLGKKVTLRTGGARFDSNLSAVSLFDATPATTVAATTTTTTTQQLEQIFMGDYGGNAPTFAPPNPAKAAITYDLNEAAGQPMWRWNGTAWI